MTDHGLLAHRAAEAHLEACWEALMGEIDGDDVTWPDIAAPFCGCGTCEVREVLHAAWPHIVEHARTFPTADADPPVVDEGRAGRKG